MSKVKAIIAPVAEEVGKFAETAKKQVNPNDNIGENNQAENTQLVKDIYKPQEEHTSEELLKKQAEDKKKEKQLLYSLHQQYVQSTFNSPKPKEEKPAEKAERQKMEDLEETRKKEKKQIPLNVQRAQNIEKNRGSSG